MYALISGIKAWMCFGGHYSVCLNSFYWKASCNTTYIYSLAGNDPSANNCFQDFIFVFGFQQLEYCVFRCGFLCLYPIWSFVKLLGCVPFMSYQIQEIISFLFFLLLRLICMLVYFVFHSTADCVSFSLFLILLRLDISIALHLSLWSFFLLPA